MWAIKRDVSNSSELFVGRAWFLAVFNVAHIAFLGACRAACLRSLALKQIIFVKYRRLAHKMKRFVSFKMIMTINSAGIFKDKALNNFICRF